MPDLVTAAYAQSLLTRLSTAQIAALPMAIASASRMIRNYCQRYISRQPSADGTRMAVDELITPPIRGKFLLREWPINDVFRVATGPNTVISIYQANTTINQRATVKLIMTGSVDQGQTVTGILLFTMASGVATNTPIMFASLVPPTIQTLANAIGAVTGWIATPEPDHALNAVADFRPTQGVQPSLGGSNQAELTQYTEDVAWEVDAESGILVIGDNQRADPFSSASWGPSPGDTINDSDERYSYLGLRVTYDAGYDPVPEDLMDATVEVVKALFERKMTDSVKLSEKTDTYSYAVREVVEALPSAVRDVLAQYRSHAK